MVRYSRSNIHTAMAGPARQNLFLIPKITHSRRKVLTIARRPSGGSPAAPPSEIQPHYLAILRLSPNLSSIFGLSRWLCWPRPLLRCTYTAHSCMICCRTLRGPSTPTWGRYSHLCGVRVYHKPEQTAAHPLTVLSRCSETYMGWYDREKAGCSSTCLGEEDTEVEGVSGFEERRGRFPDGHTGAGRGGLVLEGRRHGRLSFAAGSFQGSGDQGFKIVDPPRRSLSRFGQGPSTFRSNKYTSGV